MRSVNTDATAKLDFTETALGAVTLHWSHVVPVSGANWTPYLLSKGQLDKVGEARALPEIVPFGTVAKLEVSLVTGANNFFSLSDDEVAAHGLSDWVVPLLARIRHASGLVYTRADHRTAARVGLKAWFLKLHTNGCDPNKDRAVKKYLSLGERDGLHLRYKTSIRERWYEVPWVEPRPLLLSKRSHNYPRLVLNRADATTTDTIYQGRVLPLFQSRPEQVVGLFHNSLTLLTAEIEGRSFGGGVLELVPSEISRLSFPWLPESRVDLAALDEFVRGSSDPDGAAVEATNRILRAEQPSMSPQLLDDLEDARRTLLARRLSRNRSKQSDGRD